MFNEPQLQQVHRLQMFTEIFRLQKTTDDVLIQHPKQLRRMFGMVGSGRERVVVLQRERMSKPQKQKEPNLLKKRWTEEPKQKSSSGLKTSHHRRRAAGRINRVYLITTEYKQNKQLMIIFLCLGEYLSDGHEHLQTVKWSKQRKQRQENLSCSVDSHRQKHRPD